MAGKGYISCIVLLVIDIHLTACRLLLLSVIRPSIEYGGEIW